MLFPLTWLDERAATDPHAEFNGNTPDNAKAKTNRDVQAEVRHFPLSFRVADE